MIAATLVVLAVSAGAAGATGAAADAPAKPGAPRPTVVEVTRGLERRAGLLDLYLDRAKGKVWLAVARPRDSAGTVGSYLYVEGLVSGLGSNPVGLDRGQLGDAMVVTLRRLGGKILVEQQNLRFRALSSDPRERAAVDESFATSVLWAGEVAAEDADGRRLVDFTSFIVRDAHGVVEQMRATGQGSFNLDAARSAVDLEACLAFADNLELEAVLTYQSDQPGELVRGTAPNGHAVTLVQHHSLLALPDGGYRPRRFDPRAGLNAISFADYASPLAAPLSVRWIVRHRLEKVDPAAARSRVKEPIVYYVDRGAPEPVRSALLAGASWWKEAFEQAGFIDAFRVELLPEGAHPLDARYNVIQWVHRATRGWSYGGGVVDPRTGEMIKGHVTLGSLRVRQDRLLFEGLAGTAKTGTGAADDPVELALWRIRQLAAHEVGHSLGLAHNFAASTYAGRASVMDYPAPLVSVGGDGSLDFSRAYTNGVGEWDVQAIRYAYAQFPPGVDEAQALDALVRDGLAHGLLFLTDRDARPLGSAHPRAHLWDNGTDPVAGLELALRVRAVALSRFGEGNLAAGQPLSLLQEVFTPVYFHHRYELEAVAKLVGGYDYTYAVQGDGQPRGAPVDGAWQRRALAAVLGAISPETLDIPDAVLALLLPRPPEVEPTPEIPAGATDPVFDPLAAAATAADQAISALLEPSRAARLVELHRRDGGLPGLEEVLDAVVDTTFAPAAAQSPRHREIGRAVEAVVVWRLLGLAASPTTPPAVSSRVEARLAALADELAKPEIDATEAAHRSRLGREIRRYLEGRGAPADRRWEPFPMPPGAPIGEPALALPEGWSGCSQDG